MSNDLRIENWSLVCTTMDMYTPPEAYQFSLNGEVYGHPRFQDGERITTSTIKSTKGKTVKTWSGSVYKLGQPSQEYVNFCQNKGKTINEENPLGMVGDIEND